MKIKKRTVIGYIRKWRSIYVLESKVSASVLYYKIQSFSFQIEKGGESFNTGKLRQ